MTAERSQSTPTLEHGSEVNGHSIAYPKSRCQIARVNN